MADSHNLEQIHQLNQRGGRELSVLDLVAAGTLDLELASYLAGAVRSGASLLTAARPGHAGKTTVLASLLPFLPKGRRIVTVTSTRALSHIAPNTCLLAPEIGRAPHFGYLWNDSARRYVESIGPDVSAISCLHADTLEELRDVLCGEEIGVSTEAFAQIDLIAFLRLDRLAGDYRRRVAAVYESDGQRHRRIFQWDEKKDRFVAGDAKPRFGAVAARMRELLAGLTKERHTDFDSVFSAAQGR